MTDEATMAPVTGVYAGLDRYEARQRVKDALSVRGLLVKVEPHRHSLGHCSRCGTVVEPRLSEQWFVAVTPLAQAAIAAVEDGRTRFVPASGFREAKRIRASPSASTGTMTSRAFSARCAGVR